MAQLNRNRPHLKKCKIKQKYFTSNCENGYSKSFSYFFKETIFKPKIKDQLIPTFKNILSKRDRKALFSENHPHIVYNEL